MLRLFFLYGPLLAALWMLRRVRQELRSLRQEQGARDLIVAELHNRLAHLEGQLGTRKTDEFAHPGHLAGEAMRPEGFAERLPAVPQSHGEWDAARAERVETVLISPPQVPPLPPPPDLPPAPAAPLPSRTPLTSSEVPAGLPPPRRPPPPTSTPIDWESLVGVKLFSWIAGLALVVAAVFFLRYSIDRGWLGPPIRMAIGLAVGTSLLLFCELRAARRYPVTANALDAAGIAILFATLFASHALWNLLPQLPVFLLMALVTAVAALLSIRRDSLFIALLGLLGGFATPALLSTGQDRPLGLFAYLFLLNAGLAWVAYRKQWALLTALSIALTTLYQWAWVLKYLDAARLPLAIGIFLIFPILHVMALIRSDRRRGTAEPPEFGMIAAAAATLPLLFAVYLAVVRSFGELYHLLFGFLFVVVAGLAAIALQRGPAILHALGAGSALLVTALWLGNSYGHAAWPGILFWLALLVALLLTVPEIARRRGGWRDIPPANLFAPLMLGAFPALVRLEPDTAEPLLLFGVLFVLISAIAVVAIERQEGRLHACSAVFVLAAEALWSARYLAPQRLMTGLVLYAVFALFYLGVPVLAERRGKPLQPHGSGSVVLFATLLLLLWLSVMPLAAAAVWGMALLLAVLNVGLFYEAACGRLPLLTLAGIILSWIVIAVWWSTALHSAPLLPSLLVVAGFALLVLAGSVWGLQRASAAGRSSDSDQVVQRMTLLSLVGHAFLLMVAAQATLAVPPWPLFAVLALLDLAIGTVALYQRRALAHGAAVVVSQVLLAVWVIAAEGAPWPLVAMLSACGVAGFALLWVTLASRRVVETVDFERSAIAALFLSLAVVFVASLRPQAPGLAWLAPIHGGLLLTVLACAARRGWHSLAVVAVLAAALQSWWWLSAHGSQATWLYDLAYLTEQYGFFLLYPMVLGRRVGRALEPYLVAVVASLTFFLLARHSIVTGGYGSVIGVLPVVQAALLLGVLLAALRLESPAQRDDTQIALLAGASLAFVTAAIPLQVEREWITIGWALEVPALAWLYTRLRHQGLLLWISGLAAAVFIRLALNPAVLSYHARSAVPIWNWYLYTYGVAAAALFGAAYQLRGLDDQLAGLRVRAALNGAAVLLLFLLLNVQIADYYSPGTTLTFDLHAGLAQDLTYTIGWALFALALLASGIAGETRVARGAALALLLVTIVKCFLSDLWRLGGLYRVGSFVGLAVCLAMVALLLQRFVLAAPQEAVE